MYLGVGGWRGVETIHVCSLIGGGGGGGGLEEVTEVSELRHTMSLSESRLVKRHRIRIKQLCRVPLERQRKTTVCAILSHHNE